MRLTREKYGETKAGEQVDIFSIDNGWMNCSLMSYGASLVSVEMPDKNGKKEEITLGFDNFAGWEGEHPYFGATIGRFGNRIAGGSFDMDGKTFKLAKNDGNHHLHGGERGFDKVVWEAFPFKYDDEAGVKFCYTSKDGEEGYPGNLDVITTISLTSDNRIVFEYKAGCDGKTPVNLTNHTYWNLRNQGTIYDHVLKLDADRFLAVDDELIPTGAYTEVASGPFDFRTPTRIGDQIEAAGGYDHCFVLNSGAAEEESPRRNNNEAYDPPLCGVVEEINSGRIMTIYTNQPGVQFYSGNFLDNGTVGRRTYEQHGSICLETQGFPDSVHHSHFPDPFLEPGVEYYHLTIHEFSIAKE